MPISLNTFRSINLNQPQHLGVAFKADTIPAANKEQTPDTFHKEGLSTGKKALIATGAILGITAAGVGIKKGMALHKLKKEAASYGINDVKLYKELKNVFVNITKHNGEKIERSDILTLMDQMLKNGSITNGDNFGIFSRKETQDIFATCASKGKTIPENSFTIAVQGADKSIKIRELIIANKIGDSLTDIINGDSSLIIPIKF